MPDAITTVARSPDAILMRLLLFLHHSADWRHMLEYCTAAAARAGRRQGSCITHLFPILERSSLRL